MIDEKATKSSDILLHRNTVLRGFLILSCLVLFLVVYSNLANIYLILGLILLFFVYIFFKDDLWVFLVLSVPLLTLGQFIPLNVTNGWTYDASLSEIFIFAALVVFILNKFLQGRIFKLKTDYLFLLLFVYLAIALFSYFRASDIHLFVGQMKIIAFSVAAYFLSLNLLDSEKKIKVFIYSLGVTAFILSLQIFAKFYEMGFSAKFFFERSSIKIPMGAIALVSAFLAMLLPILLAFYFGADKQEKSKPFMLVFFIAGTLGIFLSLGKGAIFSFLLGLVYLFFRMKKVRMFFILFLSFLSIFGYLIFTPFFSGLYQRIETSFTDKNFQFRTTEYKAGWKAINDSPLLGIGVGQQSAYLERELGIEYRELFDNFFLQVGTDTGVIGLFVAFLILAHILRKARKFSKNFKARQDYSFYIYGFIATLITVFINGLVEVTIFTLPYALCLWLIIGVFSNLKTIGLAKMVEPIK